MNILLIGSGGREHALAWKIAQSPTVNNLGANNLGTNNLGANNLYAAPSNPGMAEVAQTIDVTITDHAAIAEFCQSHAIDLVVIGPEAPLVAGLADDLRAADISVFGPDKAAAQLEGSKAFTKSICDKANIPTAGYAHLYDKASALAALDDFQIPVVIKADGLAAGKGVIIAESREDAEAAIEEMFSGGFGDAGAQVVIEEFMHGEEASFFALTDGKNIMRFGSAQDHKRVGEGDIGPNTGGMGAYSPAPVLTPSLEDRVMRDIIEPTVKAMAAEGMPYNGVLYAGLMLTEDGPKLIEYNCRFGDPECQVLMMRYHGDFAALLKRIADGALGADEAMEFSNQSAMTVVMAAKGYPASPEKGGAIDLGAQNVDVQIFHAGTAIKDGALLANGGRVLNVTAMGESVTAAQKSVYAAIDKIDFPSGFYRRDIGHREIAREAESG